MKTRNKVIFSVLAVAGIGGGIAYAQNPQQTNAKLSKIAPQHENGKTTVADTKTNEELAATVISLYGAKHIQKNPAWQKVATTLGQPLKLVKVPVSNTLTDYRLIIPQTDTTNAPYYRLSGANHDTVTYYDGTTNAVLAVTNLKTIVKFINQHNSSAQQEKIATQITIKYH